MAEAPEGVRVRLWDAPVRIFHWALVGLILFAWWSAEDHLDWHGVAGYAIIGLVIFRIWWGFVGGEAARFAHFVKGPVTTFRYLGGLASRAPSLTVGHNPVGALSVLAILIVLAAQLVTGLFAVDLDQIDAGPLSDRVSFEMGRELARLHETSFRVLQALVVLHVAAIAYYLIWKRSNLIGPMITGRRTLPSDPGLRRGPPWALIVGATVAAAAAWFVSKGLRI